MVEKGRERGGVRDEGVEGGEGRKEDLCGAVNNICDYSYCYPCRCNCHRSYMHLFFISVVKARL